MTELFYSVSKKKHIYNYLRIISIQLIIIMTIIITINSNSLYTIIYLYSVSEQKYLRTVQNDV